MNRRLSERLLALYERLESAHGYQGWWPLAPRGGRPGYDPEGYRISPGVKEPLDGDDRLEIAVGAVLTQNTAWSNARRALAALREKAKLTSARIAELSQSELATIIRPSGYYNQKARKIKGLVAFFDRAIDDGAGRVSGTQLSAPGRAELLDLWGIGPETADSILLYAFGVATFVVDAYAQRILRRLGLVTDRLGYPALQELFHSNLPPDNELFGEFHALFVRHARLFCRAKPRCTDCPLRPVCHYSRSHGG